MKFDTSSSTIAAAPQPSQTTVQDVQDEENPSNFAPGGDADYFVEEDAEGRFFGGGLTSEQKDILNIFDSAEQEGEQEVSVLL